MTKKEALKIARESWVTQAEIDDPAEAAAEIARLLMNAYRRGLRAGRGRCTLQHWVKPSV
jgi:hypothetical protein